MHNSIYNTVGKEHLRESRRGGRGEERIGKRHLRDGYSLGSLAEGASEESTYVTDMSAPGSEEHLHSSSDLGFLAEGAEKHLRAFPSAIHLGCLAGIMPYVIVRMS